MNGDSGWERRHCCSLQSQQGWSPAWRRPPAAVEALEGDGHRARVSAPPGHRAALGIMALGPALARLQAFQAELAAVPGLRPASSFVSLTETSEYTTTEEQERERLSSHG